MDIWTNKLKESSNLRANKIAGELPILLTLAAWHLPPRLTLFESSGATCEGGAACY
jgi:hypothetical protein